MRKIGVFVIGLITVTLLASPSSQSETNGGADAKPFIGTWRLVSFTQLDGQPVPDRGTHPTGLIYYDATGQMAAQIMPDSPPRRAFAGSEPTPEEALAALRGYTAYFGTYTVDERARTVTHHREGNIKAALNDVVRRYEFLPGDRVALMPVENQTRLVWERVK